MITSIENQPNVDIIFEMQSVLFEKIGNIQGDLQNLRNYLDNERKKLKKLNTVLHN